MADIIVDSLDSVDESLRGAYVEADGKFTLDPDRYAEFKAQGLKKKVSELIGKEKKLKEELGRFEKFKDVDPDALEEFFESRDSESNSGNGDGKGKAQTPDDPVLRRLTKQVEKLQGQLKGAEDSWQQEKAQMEAELKHYKLTVPLKEIALKAGVLPEDIDVALMETAKRFRLTDDGKIIVVDDDGDPTADTPERFFKEIYREKRPKFYAATGAGGSGAKPGQQPGNGTGKKTITRTRFNELGHGERARLMRDGVAVVD